MVYQFIAYNENREIVKGKLSAASEEAAAELLSYVGYQAINLKRFVPFLSLDRLLESLFRVKPAEIILFYRNLALLLESGIDIVTSLELLREQATNRTLKRILGEVICDLRGGNQLSTALSKHPEVFSPIYCQLLGVGEQSGGLETVLRQIADYMEREATTTKDIKNALMYPIITFLVTIVVIGILVTFVLPSFGNLYSSLGIDLPLPVKILNTIAGKIQSHGIYLLLAIFIVAGLAFIYIKTPGGRYKWDKLLLRLPVVGRVNHLSELSRCCRSISLLFRAGLPLTEVMSMVVRGTSNRAMTRALIDVQQDMVKGEGLCRPMAKHNLFLPMMVQMVKVGEETGNLDTTLLAVARSYETEAEDRTRSLISLIQPTMTVIIGLIIGLIALSLTSAMYSLYGQGF
ncbi:MAG: type II secretion system F family protein [Dehalococcoidales bacterium]